MSMRTTYHCDKCDAEHNKSHFSTSGFTVEMSGTYAKTVDLCEPCGKKLWNWLDNSPRWPGDKEDQTLEEKP